MCQQSNPILRRLIHTAALVFLTVISGPAAANPASVAETGVLEGARRWLSEQHGQGANDIRFEPLDARLRLPDCAGGWRYDHPFSSTETLRARCANPQSQLYLRISRQTASRESQVKQSDISGQQKVQVYRLRSAVRAGEWINPDLIETQSLALIDVPPGRLSGPLADKLMLNRDLPAGSLLRQGDLAKTRKALILLTNIPRGTVLRADFFTLAEVDSQGLPPQIIDDPQHVIDAEPVRDLTAGQVLRSSDIRPALLVRKGQVVRLNVGQKTGFTVSATVEALQDGRRGEIIKLKNIESGRVINGLVTGQSAAQSL